MEHTKFLELDFESMLKKYNAKWVIARARFELEDTLVMGDDYTVSTWPLKAGPLRFERVFKITSGQKAIVNSLTEWCVIDADTNAVIRSNKIDFPVSDYLTDKGVKNGFSGIKLELEQKDEVFCRKMRVCDLDFNNHVNNISYIKLALDCFSSAELKALNIKSFEMYYLSQCFEGDTITLYKKEYENGWFIVAKCGERPVFRCTVNL
jgi:acyl-ACP thioesterase